MTKNTGIHFRPCVILVKWYARGMEFKEAVDGEEGVVHIGVNTSGAMSKRDLITVCKHLITLCEEDKLEMIEVYETDPKKRREWNLFLKVE